MVAVALAIPACGPSADPPASSTTETTPNETSSTGVHGGASSASQGATEGDSVTTITQDSSGDHRGSGDTTGDEQGDEQGGSTTTGEIACDPQPWFQCAMPWDCRGAETHIVECGHLTSYFDEHGCPRPKCEPRTNDCPEGMRCHIPLIECQKQEWWCLPQSLGCGDSPGPDGRMQCSCGADGECGGAVCVPEAEFPEDEFPEGFCGDPRDSP